MKEMASPTGVYKKWHPPGDHYDEVADFLGGLARVVVTSNLRAFGATVRVRDLAKFNSERKLSIDAYSLAVYGCMLEGLRRSDPEQLFERAPGGRFGLGDGPLFRLVLRL
jgi:hypothetical protein